MFHVELRQFPHQARAFNLTPEELQSRVVSPWTRGLPFELQERRWDPRRAKLVIYEGRRLDPSEIGLGRGWANVTKHGTEVTEAMLGAGRKPERLDDLAAALADGPRTLPEAEAIAAELGLQPEQAIWQLLREGRLRLTP